MMPDKAELLEKIVYVTKSTRMCISHNIITWEKTNKQTSWSDIQREQPIDRFPQNNHLYFLYNIRSLSYFLDMVKSSQEEYLPFFLTSNSFIKTTVISMLRYTLLN